VIKSNDIFQLVDSPASVKPDHIAALEEVVATFPYYGTAHLLLAAATHLHDHHAYQKVLKRTAINVPNRSRLFNLVEFVKITPSPEQVQLDHQESVVPPIPSTNIVEVNRVVPVEEEQLAPVTQDQLATEKTVIAETITKEKQPDLSDQVEVEMSRSLLNAIIEKEVIKTPELHQQALSRPESFGDWLAFMKKNNGQPYREIEEKVNQEKARKVILQEAKLSSAQPPVVEKRKKNLEIMDKIIANNPGPIRVKEEKFFTPEAKAKESLIENEHLVTETLARIYALQGNSSKAIRAYEILSLKYPQKSAYFASLILKLRQNE
jgi:hypothetical protein